MPQIKSTLFAILFMLLAGCVTTEPARFYTLTPMIGPDSEALLETTVQEVGLGVGPVSIPDYLDRRQIVTYSNQNRLKIAEFDRWGGSVKDDVLRVLSENLSNLLSTDRVFLYPWRGSAPIDYQIEVEIIQLNGQLGGDILLTARWTIIGGKDRKALVIKRSRFTESAGAQGYEAMVEAQSRALGHLSRDIAVSIKDILHGPSEQ
ncbi:MAG: membrane integrity-associated transporter subunit PqiC [Syntrophaceae bacterium]|nr:membrane integrity-associated transporter subunit PqiC [Syntrophaceae bacterium]